MRAGSVTPDTVNQESPNMKTSNNILNTTCLCSCVAIVAAVSLGFSATRMSAAEATKGGQKLVQLNAIKTTEAAESLQRGDMIAMVCSKCKSITVTYVGPRTGKATAPFMTVGEKHLCPGCSSTIEVVGHGKDKKAEVRHLCKACGDDSAFCCATKPANKPTKGMEK